MPQMWPMYWELMSLMTITTMLLMGNKSNFFKLNTTGQQMVYYTSKKTNKMIMSW